LGVLESRVARVILAAAVIDDVLGLLVLAVVTGVGKGAISYVTIGLVTLEAVGFILFLIIIGKRVVPLVAPKLDYFKSRNAPFVLAVLFCLGLSAVASFIHLAAIVGAFMAGMVLAEFNIEFRLSLKFESLYDFLVPFFFVVMGTQVDLSVFGKINLIQAAIVLTIFAILGKLIGCGLGGLNLGLKEAALVGVGMVPRGEVGMIVASIGLTMGAISSDLYSIVIFMVIVTTLLTPPVLAKMISKGLLRKKGENPAEGGGEERVEEIPVDL
jgi:Kef-type K+ transport system membrane component KefB